MILKNCLVILTLISLFACTPDKTKVALGTLERDRIVHTATTNEVIIALPVSQGSAVLKGDVLVKLDDTYQQTQVARAQADVAQAQANFDKLVKGAREEEIAAARANLAGLQAKYLQTQTNYERLKNIAKEQLISQDKLDQALAERELAQASVTNAKEKLQELVNGTRNEDLQIAEAHLSSLQAILAGEIKKLDDLTIKATRNGILDNLPWNLGERVNAGTTVAVVLAGETPYARVYIPETVRAKIKVNNELIVHVDGITESFVAMVRKIATEPAFTPYYAMNQQERARLMYLTELQLPEQAANLPSGLIVEVTLP